MIARIKRLLHRFQEDEVELPGAQEVERAIERGDESLRRSMATINGDVGWFLCLTKNPACGRKGTNENGA